MTPDDSLTPGACYLTRQRGGKAADGNKLVLRRSRRTLKTGDPLLALVRQDRQEVGSENGGRGQEPGMWGLGKGWKKPETGSVLQPPEGPALQSPWP